MQIDIKRLKRSELYSEELSIYLKESNDKEIFKWFLASILFGARISEEIAKNTYKTFEKYNPLRPKKILKAGWDFLVNPIMREGGYEINLDLDRYNRKSMAIVRIEAGLIRLRNEI